MWGKIGETYLMKEMMQKKILLNTFEKILTIPDHSISRIL